MQGITRTQIVEATTLAEHDAAQAAKAAIPPESPDVSASISVHVRNGNEQGAVQTHISTTSTDGWVEISTYPLSLVVFVNKGFNARAIAKAFNDLAEQLDG